MERLGAAEARVVGCLAEKQLTTPQQYPLSLNSLVTACNQASNREPVTAYTEGEVLAALESLKSAKLVRFVLPSHGRSVVRYRHVLDEVLGLDGSQLAVLAVLLLRGPQTLGELRARTERMAPLDSLGAVAHELDLLAGREEPLAIRLERRPGQKEERWADLLGPERIAPATFPAAPGPPGSSGAPAGAGLAAPGPPGAPPAGLLRLDELSAELADLRSEVAELRAAVEDLRDSLGG